MDRISQLPIEIQAIIWQMVYQDIAATKIQNRFRRWILRFAKHELWNELRILLCNKIQFEDLTILMKDFMVRREWSCEPCSWIYTCIKHPEYLDIIVKEVKCGIWGLK
jgi:hypothetical protein